MRIAILRVTEEKPVSTTIFALATRHLTRNRVFSPRCVQDCIFQKFEIGYKSLG
ncbi:hypothetical protein AVDCRST_MAG84-1543 [uncultured Microcoleus sp.]|uniref:Uncharacterized protein n=1 Tax=uncultured Microcoleus sp. TaxID=259945 RepID=A0A6J4L5F7_9CYAN|nr:hypothetical protein AVDCRST_MAG84-1543 [uncultured Microcoleus sp.]